MDTMIIPVDKTPYFKLSFSIHYIPFLPVSLYFPDVPENYRIQPHCAEYVTIDHIGCPVGPEIYKGGPMSTFRDTQMTTTNHRARP
jgi:hypothetical protein